jgi:putative transposase
MRRTIKLILQKDERIVETIRTYNKACNYCLSIGFKIKTHNKSKLHKATYKQIRKKFPKLNSSYVCAARDQASDMLKRERLRKLPKKKLSSGIRLNHNTFAPFLKKGIISLSTTFGRIKISVNIAKHFKQYLDWKISAATLFLKNGNLFLHLIAEIKTPSKIIPTKPLGIDRGIINPVVTSDAQFFNSNHIRAVKGKYTWLRQRLQSKGTRSAKRHLRKLSGREQRFMKDVNHCISKAIANSDADLFVLEKLSIRRSKKNGKRFNKKLGTWAFRQFQVFLEYKAEFLGKTVEYVDPKHTSQRCSKCGEVRKANRKGVWYRCTCGFSLNSDLNAARNILALSKFFGQEAAVNQPIATGLS